MILFIPSSISSFFLQIEMRINPSELCNLDSKQKEELITKGFLSGDIFEINHTAIEHHDSYIDKSSKEIC